MPNDFKKLRAYQLSAMLADDIHSVVKHWPEWERKRTGDQLVRCADAVPANIAEGMNRRSRADRTHFLRVAKSSLAETENWLERAHRRGLIDDERTDQVDEASRVLNGLIRRPL